MPEIGWSMIFDGWSPLIRTLVIGVLGYFFLVVLLRLSGKRTLSKMNAFDFVVTIAFGSTLSSMLTSNQVSLTQGMLALSLLVLLQFVNTFAALRSAKYQDLLKAQPSLLFFQGEFLPGAMRQQRVTREEILAAIRQHGVTQPEDVDAVVLETEGSLSVLRDQAATVDKLASLGVHVDLPPRAPA